MPEQAPPKGPKPTAPKAEGERIAKVLSRAGVASRREAERMIELGEVKVNGKVITSPALNVTDQDRITVNGQPLAEKEPARLWLYYKPEGLVTSASDEKGRETVFDMLPEDMPRVMSVGRLDLNSEGLLLLTNDGGLKRQLELPSTGWLRKYRVRVHGNPTDPDLEPLRKGIVVDGEKFQPMQVVLDRVQGANAWLTVGLREGKNREIRRAMSEIGLTVNRLIRISYGPFRLNELQPGQVEEVKGRILRDQLGFDPDSGEAPGPRTAPTRSMKTRSVTRSGSSPRPPKVEGDAPARPRSFGTRAAREAEGDAPRKPRSTPAADRPRATGERFGDTAAKPKARSTTAPRPDRARPAMDDFDPARGPGRPSRAKPAPGKSAPGKPAGAKPTGAKPAGGKTFGAKPARPAGDGTRRPEGPRGPAKPRR